MIRQGAARRASTPKRPSRSYVKAVGKGDRQGHARRWASRPSRATAARRSSRRSASTATSSTEYFTWTASRIAGIGLDVIAAEVRLRHQRAFPDRPLPTAHARRRRPVPVPPRRRVPPLQPGDASTSCSTPAAPATTRSSRSTRKLVDDQAKHLCTLRGLMELEFARARRCRSRRSSRSTRSSSASRPARCRTARSAARRTRRWPSP